MPAQLPLLTKLRTWCFPQVLFSPPRTTGVCYDNPLVNWSLTLLRLRPPGGQDCLVFIPDHVLWVHRECLMSEWIILAAKDFSLDFRSTPSQLQACRWTPDGGASVVGPPRPTLLGILRGSQPGGSWTSHPAAPSLRIAQRDPIFLILLDKI